MDIATYLETEGVSQAEFARQLDVTPGFVWQLLNGERPIPAERVLEIEAATGGKCSRHHLRPDIYPAERQL